MSKVFQVWCEYDIGQEYYVFEDSGLAEEWADEAAKAQGLDGFDNLHEDGLIGIEPLELKTRE